MFAGFETRRLTLSDGVILETLVAGSGAPVLLLHGFPQTRAAWHRVAPILAERFQVIVPDLPGYGRSVAGGGDLTAAMAKRRLAGVMVEAMAALGHPRFDIAGHDRGGRVAYRLALDHPERVRRLALLDIVPTLTVWERMDWRAALAAYHWPFLAQGGGIVERMIGADPVAYLDHLLDRWAGSGQPIAAEARADYAASIARPAVIAAMAADYRAGAGPDVAADQADRASLRRIMAPLLLLRGVEYLPDPISEAWAPLMRGPISKTVTETPLTAGHFLAEERPEETAAALLRFFAD